jgi:hypothetical protein
MPFNDEGLPFNLPKRRLDDFAGLRAGGGTMAQFSHADVGGMCSGRLGMTMAGDMFNNNLKSKT